MIEIAEERDGKKIHQIRDAHLAQAHADSTGELVRVSSLVDKLQLAVDSGAKIVLLPAKNKEDLAKIPDELLDQVELVFYTDPLDAASKARRIRPGSLAPRHPRKGRCEN